MYKTKYNKFTYNYSAMAVLMDVPRLELKIV